MKEYNMKPIENVLDNAIEKLKETAEKNSHHKENSFAKYVYSGECRKGTCGTDTNLVDSFGNSLFVGDIVITSTIDEFGVCFNNGLTVVVSNEFRSQSTGKGIEYLKNENEIEFFIMGIKGVDFMDKDKDRWIVKKLKSFIDVIHGEKWNEFGFNYKNH